MCGGEDSMQDWQVALHQKLAKDLLHRVSFHFSTSVSFRKFVASIP
jgi:hypothetical protein